MADELRFEWDPRKSEANRRKHGVSFESAVLVFDDPDIYEFEEGNEHGEIRFRAIGQALGRLLFVSFATFAEDGVEVVRVISARGAGQSEREAYRRHSQGQR
ncbi:MAG TPA: BrnT family toxin [Rhizomicrobium sp.]|nr:BrnT family toxin [Rhizomicrobium sp.]